MKFMPILDIRMRRGIPSSVLAALLGLVPLVSLAQPSSDPTIAGNAAIPLSNTGSKSTELPLAATVGELLKRDASDALRLDAAKDGSAVVAPLVVKPAIKGADPYLTSIFGMEGARVVRLQLADKPILTYIENARDMDKREPAWRLLAVEGRCAYFEHFAAPQKKLKNSQKKVCFKEPQLITSPTNAIAQGAAIAPGAIPLIQPNAVSAKR